MLGLKERELWQACSILFGRGNPVRRDFLDTLELADLKMAFRRRSLETHPDRFLHLGPLQQRLYNELFQEVREAYEKLSGYLKIRSRGFQFAPEPVSPGAEEFADAPVNSPAAHRASPPDTAGEKPAHAGPAPLLIELNALPPWKLRTGEFLFYSGVISWNTLIASILWQSRQRERLGEIARRWGWLSEEELWQLLEDRRLGEKFGNLLLRHHLVTPFQLKMLLLQQQRQQPLIGEYFVGQGIVSPNQLNRLVEILESRNSLLDTPLSATPRAGSH
jgi:hypothetical protein